MVRVCDDLPQRSLKGVKYASVGLSCMRPPSGAYWAGRAWQTVWKINLRDFECFVLVKKTQLVLSGP